MFETNLSERQIEKRMKRFSLIFLVTTLVVIGYFEVSVSHAEKLFWLNLGM